MFARAAAALAFDPPMARAMWPLDLWRDAREPAAFVGFEELSISSFYIRTDDRQTNNDLYISRYERRAITERIGVSYR